MHNELAAHVCKLNNKQVLQYMSYLNYVATELLRHE